MLGKTISGVTINNEFMAFQIIHSMYDGDLGIQLHYKDRIIHLN
jgi:hypothetical protein